MKRLTIDESFTELQKAAFILSKGQSFQKYAVRSPSSNNLLTITRKIYSQLPRLLKESDAQGKFLQQVFEDITTNDEELQIEAAKSFAKAIHDKVPSKLRQTFSLLSFYFRHWKRITSSESSQ